MDPSCVRVAAALGLVLQAIFSARTDIVTVPVSVVDRNGQPIIGLQRENFRLIAEGRSHEIELFAANSAAPVSIGLLLDYSQSMRPNVPALVAAVSALANSGSGDDEFFVLPFNDFVFAVTEQPVFTHDVARLRAEMEATLPAGGTALYDAVTEGIRRLGSARWEKKAVIVVSDGHDNASTARQAETIALARRSNVIIYAVAVAGPAEKRSRGADTFLKRLSDGSGGEARFATSIADVERTMLRFGQHLRQQYLLVFAADTSDSNRGPEAIKVTVVAPGKKDLRVRFRGSYEVAARNVP